MPNAMHKFQLFLYHIVKLNICKIINEVCSIRNKYL